MNVIISSCNNKIIKVKNQTSKYRKVSETKKLCLNTFKCSKFSLFYQKIIFDPKKHK